MDLKSHRKNSLSLNQQYQGLAETEEFKTSESSFQKKVALTQLDKCRTGLRILAGLTPEDSPKSDQSLFQLALEKGITPQSKKRKEHLETLFFPLIEASVQEKNWPSVLDLESRLISHILNPKSKLVLKKSGDDKSLKEVDLTLLRQIFGLHLKLPPQLQPQLINVLRQGVHAKLKSVHKVLNEFGYKCSMDDNGKSIKANLLKFLGGTDNEFSVSYSFNLGNSESAYIVCTPKA